MLLKAHCDMRKQEQRNYIIAREVDIPMQAGMSNSLAIIYRRSSLLFISDTTVSTPHPMFVPTHFAETQDNDERTQATSS